MYDIITLKLGNQVSMPSRLSVGLWWRWRQLAYSREVILDCSFRSLRIEKIGLFSQFWQSLQEYVVMSQSMKWRGIARKPMFVAGVCLTLQGKFEAHFLPHGDE